MLKQHYQGTELSGIGPVSTLEGRSNQATSERSKKAMKVCFFARGERQLLDDLGYYREDIDILNELGHEVILATRFHEIPWNCDLYFTWWYGWGILTLIKSKLARRPNIMVGPIHYHDREFGFFKRPWLQQCLMRLSLRVADAVMTVSQIEYEGMRALAAKRPFMVYHSIVPPPTVTPLAEREPLVFTIGHLVSISIGRKRFDNVVRAIPSVINKRPDVRFVIAGRKGEGFEKLEALASELKVESYVNFPGRIDSKIKAEYLQRAMVLVQPSTYEGFGLAQLEAMGYGVPVITSPAGAVPEVVGGSGLYCDKDDPQDIARNILKLLEDRDLWVRLSQEGRKRATTMFSREARRTMMTKIIDLVLSENKEQRAR
jgi:glycosyltransferase involved in cell wall biosynthesis